MVLPPIIDNNQLTKIEMKLNRILTVCAMAVTLAMGATSVMAQQDNGGGNGGGGQGGGGGRNRNFDPAQMQQRMMQGIQDRLGFTNDTDWQAVQPLVQKVMDARRDAGGGGMRGMFGGRNRNGGQGGGQQRGGGMFGQPSAEETALQNAIDSDAPAAQIKDLLKKYKASQKEKQAKLVAAQEDLKKVLTTKQEAQACIMGLVD